MADSKNQIEEVVEGSLNQKNSSIGNPSEEQDGSLQNPNQENTSTKRAFFSLAHLKNYKSDDNPTGWVPTTNEICIDDQGIYYIWTKDEEGNILKLSPLSDFLTEWNELKKLGIINNAEAFRLNGKIYNFIFDNEKMVLRLNTEIDIYEEYYYYRVRKSERDPKTGDYVYITGIRNSETREVMTTYGNIIEKDGKKVPSSAAMLETCEDGKNYIVEFFDVNKLLIGSQVYYARSAISIDFSMAPDMAITDLIVNTDRPYDEENACFLYQNEDPSALIIRVGIKYADGNVRDITEEGSTTGRLIFEGRDGIDTTQLTNSPEDAQKIKIIYFVDRDNSKNPGGMEGTTEEALLDPNTISLNKVLSVYVVEDIYDSIIDLVLHGYKESKAGTGSSTTETYKIKCYAKYESGMIRDLTPVMDATRFVSTAGFTYNSRTGCLESTKILANFAVNCLVPQGRSVAMFSKTFSCEFTEYNKRLAISRSEGGFDTKDTLKYSLINTSQSKMKLSEAENLNQLKEGYTFKYDLEISDYLVPTHVLVRNALDPSIIYSGTPGVDSYSKLEDTNGVISYNIPDNNLIFEDMPLLVEFYKITLDEETGARKEIFLTNVQRTYAKSTSTSL